MVKQPQPVEESLIPVSCRGRLTTESLWIGKKFFFQKEKRKKRNLKFLTSEVSVVKKNLAKIIQALMMSNGNNETHSKVPGEHTILY